MKIVYADLQGWTGRVSSILGWRALRLLNA